MNVRYFYPDRSLIQNTPKSLTEFTPCYFWRRVHTNGISRYKPSLICCRVSYDDKISHLWGKREESVFTENWPESIMMEMRMSMTRCWRRPPSSPANSASSKASDSTLSSSCASVTELSSLHRMSHQTRSSYNTILHGVLKKSVHLITGSCRKVCPSSPRNIKNSPPNLIELLSSH